MRRQSLSLPLICQAGKGSQVDVQICAAAAAAAATATAAALLPLATWISFSAVVIEGPAQL
jgi:hypothetical protein